MERIVFPATWVAYFTTWIVEHSVAIKFTLWIELALILGSIRKIQSAIRLIIKDICSNNLYLVFLLESDLLSLLITLNHLHFLWPLERSHLWRMMVLNQQIDRSVKLFRIVGLIIVNIEGLCFWCRSYRRKWLSSVGDGYSWHLDGWRLNFNLYWRQWLWLKFNRLDIDRCIGRLYT